jgi:hypothetical protein
MKHLTVSEARNDCQLRLRPYPPLNTVQQEVQWNKST